MKNRAERKQHRETVTKIIIDTFVTNLEKYKSYSDAIEATSNVIKRAIEEDPRAKELYNHCMSECEETTIKIAEEYLNEKNSEARIRKMKKI